MIDRDMIVEELEIVKRRVARLDGFSEEAEVIADAIALLKAQEPRVLSESELLSIGPSTPVWIEEPFEGVDFGGWAMIRLNCIIYPERGEQCYFKDGALDGMGVTWRCWTSRPTDEQREATPWQ